MPRVKLALRMSFGILGLTVLLVMIARSTGYLPTAEDQQRLRRESFCESLAIHCGLAAQHGDSEQLQAIIEYMTQRNQDARFVHVETIDGETIVHVGERTQGDSVENPAAIVASIPVIVGGKDWGNVDVGFQAGDQGFFGAVSQDPGLQFTCFLIGYGFIAYSIYCFILARNAIPTASSGVPQRVRETLNSFREGILIIDPTRRVAFANKAFCDSAGMESEEIEGKAATDLPWTDVNLSGEMPWERTSDGDQQRDVMKLRDTQDSVRPMSVRAVSIKDDHGNQFGTLATFDDLTQVERMNSRLRRLLNSLRKSRAKVREQNRELTRLATRDPMTNCLNRRAFYEKYHPIFSLSARHRQALGCLMIDIDKFKSINDTKGHAVGDEVIKAVAAALESCRRDTDLLCRFGGEEFCMLLPETDSEGVRIAGERCRSTIEKLQVEDLKITASVGGSDLSYGAATEDQLIEQADQALYEAKRSGRNRVITFEDVISPDPDRCEAGVASPGLAETLAEIPEPQKEA